MAYNTKKTEHAGPKKGGGAFYGRKVDAKKASNRRRREASKRTAGEGDYLVIQEKIFRGMDLDQIFKKAKEHHESGKR
jgi:hypothetical protein